MNRIAKIAAGQILGLIDGKQVLGLDIAKLVFQVHTVNMTTGEIVNKQLKRKELLPFFVNSGPFVIGIEACSGAHYWSRELTALGHEVRLVHAKVVRPFVTGNKTDATDARGIWLAIQRELYMKQRTMTINSLRGLIGEFGLTLSKGKHKMLQEIGPTLEALESQLPPYLIASYRNQLAHIKALTDLVETIEKELAAHIKTNENIKRLLKIPGVGPLTATAAIAVMGDPKAFKSGREFCAYLGLVPKQTGTGGKVNLGKISKRGDTRLRTLLVQGARAATLLAKEPKPWLEEIKKRRPLNVAVVAQAAKTARIIWAMTAHQLDYQEDHQSIKPQFA